METKEYILTGKYVDEKGKLYDRGDKISVKESDLLFFANKLLDPEKTLQRPDNIDKMERKIRSLEKEIKGLSIENASLVKQIESLVSAQNKRKK